MNVKTQSYDCGVIVARMQVAELSDAHHDLIQTVVNSHSKVIMFLGVSPVSNTSKNPLDFESRRQLVCASYPSINVLFVKDIADDILWSKRLDTQIHSLISPTQSVVLYGGRDSFLEHYSGIYPTLELEQTSFISGSEIRHKIAKSVKADKNFRKGVIWASQNRHPTVFTTVDVAIFRDNYTKILLGRKEEESQFRLVGGFSDPKDGSFEASASREMSEETGLYTLHGHGDFAYLASVNIPDWRYLDEPDCIRTILFAVEPLGTPQPGDDIYELRWFETDNPSLHQHVVPQHHEILSIALDYANKDTKD